MIELPTLGYDLLIPQGVDWPGLNFPISDADGNPYDLTGCTARGEIRPFAGSDELLYAWSSAPTGSQGRITLNDGILNIRTLAVETMPWDFTRAEYDILLINPAAPIGLQVSRVVMGQVAVSVPVTVYA